MNSTSTWSLLVAQTMELDFFVRASAYPVMTIMRSFVFFGLPGLFIWLGIHFAVPLATEFGMPLILSWTLALWLPVILLVAWVLVRGLERGSAISFKDRFRLQRLSRRDWVVIVVALLGLQLCELLLSGTGRFFASFDVFPKPAVIPELFDPALDIGSGLSTFFGVPALGNWWLIAFWFGWLVVNIGGEELLWRGYALPLQERAIGRYAWLVNGLCWNLLIHAFMSWNFLTLMPISLVIPFLVQRYKNTWIGIWIHGVGNLLVLAILIPSIAGWI